ncbi:hypothetical protein E2562_002713 [Oryza meyeriana var. granulata]|uniref:Secreted protein n=1 Tax=Oryza meyeriana var. granulata TaxID=110450 RepID=A0A6G1BRC6_9ORYZ|nr:hypothetical protein E2562_002713 [Oryza meyeriana var. granulata]
MLLSLPQRGLSIPTVIMLLFFAAAAPRPSQSVFFLGSFRSPGAAAMSADGVAACDARLARGE